MNIPTPAQLTAAFAHHGHPMPLGVHLVLLRNRKGTLDAFDDMLCVMQGGEVLAHACRCTTDPGKPYRQKPMNADGCAVWAVGQVIDGLQFGKHKGEYPCLVPAKPIPVLRYTSVEDLTGDPGTSMTTQVHRASVSHESAVVGSWSAGCTVIANPRDFDTVMGFAHTSGQARFTVTLMEWG